MATQQGNDATTVWNVRHLASSCISIPEHADAVLTFAAQELASYLRRITGNDIRIVPRPELSAYSLAIAARGISSSLPPGPSCLRGYVIQPRTDTIFVRGETAGAVLRGVYRLLEQLGCVWSIHGRLFETVPARVEEKICFRETCETSRFLSVAYCSDILSWHYTQPELLRERVREDQELVDWMGKTGATRFFFIRHPFDTQSRIEELQKQFACRGIDVEVGGHILPTLLDRQWFAQHPEYFPLKYGGKRSETGNLCASHPRARQLVAEQAVRVLESLNGVKGLHVWGADVFGGGWCRCPNCQHLSPQEQSVLVCNAVAEELTKEGFEVPVYYLAYHDTIEPRLRIQPHPFVWCEFAPRERCYGHSIGDRTCGLNRHYYNALETYVQLFRRRVRVFEYYGDAILFFGCLVPVPHVIAQDVRTYEDLGVSELSFLQFGQFSRWAYAPNFTAFAAASQGASVDRALQQLWKQWHQNPNLLCQAFAELETTMRSLVRYGDIRVVPKRPAQRAELRAGLFAHLPRLSEIAAELDSAGLPSLQALALLVRYTQTVFEGVAHEIDTGTSAEAIYSHALNLLQSVDRTYKGVWGDLDLPVIHDIYKAAHLIPGWS